MTPKALIAVAALALLAGCKSKETLLAPCRAATLDAEQAWADAERAHAAELARFEALPKMPVDPAGGVQFVERLRAEQPKLHAIVEVAKTRKSKALAKQISEAFLKDEYASLWAPADALEKTAKATRECAPFE